jgi:hypothetical protein
MLDLHEFIVFLNTDELVNDFTAKIKEHFRARGEGYVRRLAGEKQEAIEIKDLMIEKYPELDDSKAESPTGFEAMDAWENTFAYFNKVANESYRRGHALERDMLDDNSDVRILIDFLSNKIALFERRDEEGKKTKEMDKEITSRLKDLDSIHKHTHREWLNYARVSAGNALAELEGIINRINPEPKDQSEWRGLDKLEKLNRAVAQIFEERPYEWITDATYGVVSKWSNYRPGNIPLDQLERIFVGLKQQVKRVYEAVRQEIGTTRLLLQVLDRYRMRCHWYNHDHLRALVLNESGEFIRNREEVLTRDLAIYVFDLGITVIYRPQFGKHEIDLLELDAKQPMFIEVKAYKDANAKSELVSGVSQLHAYLSSLDAHKTISQAYYVMYRLGGPIYEFPRKISTSRFTIYPVLVDLGLSSESGRNQPKPILVSEQEVLETNRYGERKLAQEAGK